MTIWEGSEGIPGAARLSRHSQLDFGCCFGMSYDKQCSRTGHNQFIIAMNYKRSYKLSWFERKKEIDQQNRHIQVEEHNNQPTLTHQAGSEHQFAADVARQKIPYIARRQPDVSFTIAMPKSVNIQDIQAAINQLAPTIQSKYYHSNEEGNVISYIFKFATTEDSLKAYKTLTQDLHLDLVWCTEPYPSDLNKLSIPQSPLLRRVIDRLAKRVVENGSCFQKYLMKLGHPLFEFMNHHNSCEYRYYRWKALMELFSPSSETSTPFQQNIQSPILLQENGFYVQPPSQYRAPKILTQSKRVYFSKLLSNLSLNNNDIAKLMVYAIKNSQYSAEIAIIITQSPYSSDKEFISRVYLLSDILHNSLALNYSGLFKILLPNFLYRAVQHKISQETRQQVMSILKIWRQLLIYDQQFFEGLEFTLSLTEETSTIHFELLNKSYEEVYDWCVRSGVPTLGSFHLHLSKYLQQKEMIASGRIEGVYDGVPLSEQDISKIKSQNVDVMTYHSLEYLDAWKVRQ